MPSACGIVIYEAHALIIKTPLSPSGVLLIRAESLNTNLVPGSASFTTTCPHLSIPAGAFAVPANGDGSVEFAFPYNLSSYSDCGVAQCGSITATLNDNDGCTSQVTIPVYVWNACDSDDVVEQCGFIIPKGVYVNLQDNSTWNILLPVMSNFGYNHPEPIEEGRNYTAVLSISSESCGVLPAGVVESQLVFDKTGHVFSFSLDLDEVDPNSVECGENILACNISILVDASNDPVASGCQGAGPYAFLNVPLYMTNECPQRSCPISWNTGSQTILKNSGDTGTLVPFINNNGSSPVTVSFSSSCSYITAPSSVTIPAGQQQFVALQYDVSKFNTCGNTACGSITASVTYNNGQDVCERSLPVSILFNCPAVGTDGYVTRLYDDAGLSSVEIADDCSSISILDESIFGSMGHTEANFSGFRKISIRHMQSGAEHVMSSTGDGDELIPTASTGNFSFTYPITPGGVYEVTLCQVPTWSASAQYQANDDVVFLDGKLWAAIGDSQGVNPSTSPVSSANWLEISEDQLSDHVDKYCDTQIVVSSCDIDQCFASKYVQLACVLNCNSLDLCKNKEWLNIMKLFFLITALNEAVAQNNMSAATIIYDKAKSICNC